MTCADFTLPVAVNKFGLRLDMTCDLFAPVVPSDLLRETLAYNAPLAYSSEQIAKRQGNAAKTPLP
jgi:hypothetical protein